MQDGVVGFESGLHEKSLALLGANCNLLFTDVKRFRSPCERVTLLWKPRDSVGIERDLT